MKIGGFLYLVYMTNEEQISKNVNHPSHYTSSKSGVEVIEVTRCLCGSLSNCFKYIARYSGKFNPQEDVRKAVFYLNDYKEHPMMAYTCEKPEYVLDLIQKFIDVEEVDAIKNAMMFISNIVKLSANIPYTEMSGNKVIEDLTAFALTLPTENKK